MGISVCEQAEDSERLVLEYFDAICDSPSHIYHSALPLSPSSSWLRRCYEAEVAGEIRVLMGLPDRWDTCSRTIHFEGPPKAFAHCGDTIAVGIESNVVLLDAVTGIRKSVLSGHSDEILSLASSLDGMFLISRGGQTVNLWDVQTGGVIKTFDRKTSIASASISPDGATIALGTEFGVIHLWDVRTGKSRFIGKGQDSDVTVISFSPIDPRRLLSSLRRGTVRQWDIDGHQIGASCHEIDGVEDLAYASDGTRFVSCGGRVATVRNSESGAVVVKLDAPGKGDFRLCRFSPDGRFVACKADTMVYIWDITTSEPRLVGHVEHSDSITFIAFSSSFISGSCDRSVKFWQTSSLLKESIATDDVAGPHGSTTIESANLFAEDGIIVTSDSSGMAKTWDLTTGELKSSFLTPAKGKRATHLAGDTLIIVWWADKGKEYHIWDVYKGQLLRRFHSPLSRLLGLKISGDGSKILGFDGSHIQAVSMQTGEDAGSVELRNGGAVSFFVRGSMVGIDNQRNVGWDFGGLEVSDLREFPDRPRFDFVDSSVRRKVKPCWIEDTLTKRQVFRLPQRYTKYGTEVTWDGRYLVALPPQAAEVVVMDFDSVCPQSGL